MFEGVEGSSGPQMLCGTIIARKRRDMGWAWLEIALGGVGKSWNLVGDRSAGVMEREGAEANALRSSTEKTDDDGELVATKDRWKRAGGGHRWLCVLRLRCA